MHTSAGNHGHNNIKTNKQQQQQQQQQQKSVHSSSCIITFHNEQVGWSAVL